VDRHYIRVIQLWRTDDVIALTPLIEAGPFVVIHVIAALAGIVLGAVQLLAPKGTLPHRAIGWIWVVLLAAICTTAFFIRGSWYIGPISVFHALTVYTMWALWMGVRSARRHDVASHKSYMGWIYVLSLVLSAALALRSGELLHEVVFPGRW
jgi:uncharacterized membrane protein